MAPKWVVLLACLALLAAATTARINTTAGSAGREGDEEEDGSEDSHKQQQQQQQQSHNESDDGEEESAGSLASTGPETSEDGEITHSGQREESGVLGHVDPTVHLPSSHIDGSSHHESEESVGSPSTIAHTTSESEESQHPKREEEDSLRVEEGLELEDQQGSEEGDNEEEYSLEVTCCYKCGDTVPNPEDASDKRKIGFLTLQAWKSGEKSDSLRCDVGEKVHIPGLPDDGETIDKNLGDAEYLTKVFLPALMDCTVLGDEEAMEQDPEYQEGNEAVVVEFKSIRDAWEIRALKEAAVLVLAQEGDGADAADRTTALKHAQETSDLGEKKQEEEEEEEEESQEKLKVSEGDKQEESDDDATEKSVMVAAEEGTGSHHHQGQKVEGEPIQD